MGDEARKKIGSNLAIGELFCDDRALVTTGSAADSCTLQLNIFYRGVAQLVARMVRDSITTLGVEFSRRAENP